MTIEGLAQRRALGRVAAALLTVALTALMLTGCGSAGSGAGNAKPANLRDAAAKCGSPGVAADYGKQGKCVQNVAGLLDPNGQFGNPKVTTEGGNPTPPTTVYTFEDKVLGKCETISFDYVPAQSGQRKDPGLYRVVLQSQVQCG